jgi:hypothetical protein
MVFGNLRIGTKESCQSFFLTQLSDKSNGWLIGNPQCLRQGSISLHRPEECRIDPIGDQEDLAVDECLCFDPQQAGVGGYCTAFCNAYITCENREGSNAARSMSLPRMDTTLGRFRYFPAYAATNPAWVRK